MGSVNDGTFSGTSSIQYLGKTANDREFKYSYRTHFNWSNIPWFTLSDRVAHGGGTRSFANSYAHSYTEVPFAISLGSVSITGTGLGDFGVGEATSQLVNLTSNIFDGEMTALWPATGLFIW
ncbi:hypothetical protein P4H61_22960 [Paenibacillus peoriae]|uniref:hypothetical protein n=1 Tax=Paenibacillus peoriae TaxID=59893 RepID=UPI0011107661|nr:hypothetical protein [Paenibacillus peoriae]MEC0184348.1 hypothetical protein [Paenibacillus peoriae]